VKKFHPGVFRTLLLKVLYFADRNMIKSIGIIKIYFNPINPAPWAKIPIGANPYFAGRSEAMSYTMSFLSKVARWLFIYLVLIAVATNVKAIEIPGIGTVNLPSFRYGKLKRDRDVNRTFQTYKVLLDHKYYTSGLSNIPYAIIGISNAYKLRPGMWQAVQLTTPLLRSWVSKMDNIYGYPPYGSVILDDNGKQIGVWYSSKQWTTVIIEENSEIAILTPEPPGFIGGK
jgi:hypothetical protein